jgi:ubiquinone/menaquinone biosynthesis C-methylase UbiE
VIQGKPVDMARRRLQQVPWKAAGRTSEVQGSADDVVREVGWVFNNATGERLTLADFVSTGDEEVGSYLHLFALGTDRDDERTLVEIGSGIGRMTAAFTRRFGQVVACDLDAAFLERCRQTVATFGEVGRLRTSHVADGRSLELSDAMADVTFSYITLQHCAHDDALALVGEAVRITRPGGQVALNFRAWTVTDAVLVPLGALMRAAWRLPKIGAWLARRRSATRLGWQANRLGPDEVLAYVAALPQSIAELRVYTSPGRSAPRQPGVSVHTFEGIHRSHWWLVARREATPDQ